MMLNIIRNLLKGYNNPNITIIDQNPSLVNTNKSSNELSLSVRIKLDNISSYGSDIIEFKIIPEQKWIQILVNDNNDNNDNDTNDNELESSNVYLTKHILNIVYKLCQSSESNAYSINIDNNNNKLQLDKDNTILFLNVLNSYLTNNDNDYYRVCPMCMKNKSYSTCILKCCKKCLPLSFNKIYDNTITDAYKRDHNLAKLLIYTTLKAVLNESRFNPVPLYCTDEKFDPKLLMPPNVHHDMDYYVDLIENSDTDRILSTKINNKEFMLLKHIILSNNTRSNYYDNSGPFHDKTIDIWKTNTKNSMILFTIDHPVDKQKRFDSSTDVVHMFHGSPIHNWYSIMRNGLKNFSGTAMMTCGQAYGPGIYLANNMAMSFGYCRNSNINDYYIMGVVQVLNSEKYKKNIGIYVVPNESDVLLKYLILLKSKNTNDFQKMESYLTKELPSNIKNSVDGSLGITRKRLNKEYEELAKTIKRLQKTNTRLINVDVNRDGNPDKSSTDTVWIIDLTVDSELNSTLNSTFNLTNTDTKLINIEIEVQFPRTFPSTSFTITCKSQTMDLSRSPMMISNINSSNINSSNINLSTNNYSYTYVDPITRYDRWRSNIRVHKVLIQMIQNILNLFKN